MKTLVFIFSILLVAGVANATYAFVNTINDFTNLTAKVNETFVYDMNDYVLGFNLTYKTSNNTVASVRPPSQLLGSANFGFGSVASDSSVISGSFPRDVYGNYNFNGLAFFLSADGYILGGILDNSTATLRGAFSFRVTSDKSYRCFGAAQLTDDIIIVDCMSTASDGTQTNWFYYVSIQAGATINSTSQISNVDSVDDGVQVFRGVRVVKHKKATYIFRYIGSSAIADPDYKNDSIIEVYTANQDIFNPTTANLINKQTVGASMLNLTSFDVLNGSLILLCNCGAVFRIDNYLPNFRNYAVNKYAVNITAPILGLTSAVELIGNIQQTTVLVWNSNNTVEIDWTVAASPYVRGGIEFDTNTVVRADFTTNFVVAHLIADNTSSLYTVRRGMSHVLGTHSVTPISNVTGGAWWGVDRVYNDVHYWDTKKTYNYRYQTPLLTFQQGVVDNSTLNITAVSYNQTSNSSDNLTLGYIVINDNDYRIYSNNTVTNLTIQYPSAHSVNVDELAFGPALNFTSPDGTFRSIENFGIYLNVALKNITYNKLSASIRNPGNFYWLLADGNTLYSFVCTDGINQNTQEVNVSCLQNGNTTLKGDILSLVVTDNYIATITSDNTSSVNFWFLSLTQFDSIPLGSPVNTCSDLTLSLDHQYIFCAQTYIKQISVWSFTSTGINTQVINRSNLPSEFVPIFSPKTVTINRNYPNYIFINNEVSVLILNLAFFWTNDANSMVRIVNNVVLTDSVLTASGFDFAVSQGSIIVFSNNVNNLTVIQEYQITVEDVEPYLVKQYSNFYTPASYLLGPGTHYSSSYTDKFLTLLYDYTTPTTSHFVQFKSGTYANNNLIRRNTTGINTTKGKLLVSGVRSTIINADYVIFTGPDGSIAPRVVYDNEIFNFRAKIDSIYSITENSTIGINIATTLTPSVDNATATFNLLTVNTQVPPTLTNVSNSSNTVNTLNIAPNSSNSEFYFNPFVYINGTVTRWALTTEKPEDQSKIALQLPVNYNTTVFNSTSNINDIYTPPRSNNSYTISDTTVSVYDSPSNTLTSVIDSTVAAMLPKNQKCTHMVVNEENQYSTSFCYDLSNPFLTYLVTVSYMSSSPFPIPAFNTSGLFKKVLSMKISGDNVFILESDGVGLNPNSRLHHFDFSNAFTPVTGKVIDAKSFSANAFQCNGFDFISIPSGIRLYFTDARYGIRTIEFDGLNWSNPQGINLFNDPQFAAQYIPYDTFFLGIASIGRSTDSASFWAALSTDNYRNFFVRLDSAPTGISVKLLTVFTKILPGTNNNKIARFGLDYFACSSYNSSNPNPQGYLNVFNITDQWNNNETQYLSDMGSINFPGAVNGSRAFAFQSNFNDDHVKLWAATPASTTSNVASTHMYKDTNTSSNNTLLNEHIVRSSYSIKVLDSNLTSDYVTLTGFNGNTSASVKLMITHNNPNPPNPNPDGKSHWPWWATLLIVLGVLTIIGAIVGFIVYRKKQNDDLETSQDVHAPLTTNYA